jgi:tRNA uracil 4-sulfurtransferase
LVKNTHVLIRFSEIWLKSKVTRSKLLHLLSRNIEAAVGERPVDRYFRLVAGYSPGIRGRLSRVFGVKSFSPARKVTHGKLEKEFREFSRQVEGRSFRVTVHRPWKGYPKKSMELEKELGAIADEFGKVDLTGFEVNLEVEIHEDGAYLFSERVPGPGGMPYGSEGKALAMFSGGIDSPVAAWMMARRGAAVELLFINPLGPALESRVSAVFKSLEPWLPGARLHVVDAKEEIDGISTAITEGERQTVYKRFMYRVAAVVARELACAGIVTGESLGQVSSQTLQSLSVINGSVDFPVFRPLIGMDKDEIVELAKRIGTFESSSSMKEFCSIETHSNANPRMEKIAREEEKLRFDFSAIASRARESTAEPLETAPPEGVKLKTIKMWEGVPELKKGEKYLFVCRQGHKSAEEVLKARSRGIEAYSLDYEKALKRGLV